MESFLDEDKPAEPDKPGCLLAMGQFLIVTFVVGLLGALMLVTHAWLVTRGFPGFEESANVVSAACSYPQGML